MPTYKDLFELNIKYVDYLLAKTSLSQAYLKNIQVTGAEIEYEVRDLLRSVLPKRFHVTHGYIVSAKNPETEPTVSPQVDVIIADTLVPHSVFMVDKQSGMEVVPVEAVIGIFEVKRTLNRSSIQGTKKEKGAVQHLNDICGSVEIQKDNPMKYLPGGAPINLVSSDMYSVGYYSNPIIGIIGVDHEQNLDKIFSGKSKGAAEGDLGMIDIVFSLRGYMLSTANTASQSPEIVHVRVKDGKRLVYGVPDISAPSAQKVAYALGFILFYLNGVCGRKIDPNSYFYNKSLFRSS